MPRALTAARAIVPPDREAPYLAALERLAGQVRARGDHFWLFRDPNTPGAFLEFSESGSAKRHRAGPDAEAVTLERTLATLASYAPDARVVWEEVSLEEC